jgi:curved DNA-binding protein CbpA
MASGPDIDDGIDPYAVLKVPRTADTGTIAATFRAMARLYHPDVHPGPEAQDQMARLNGAWAILRDPARRAAWDHAHDFLAPTSHALSRPQVTTARDTSARDACVWERGPDGEGAAGPPPGRPSGSTLYFGRHKCWTIGEIARVDPGYLRWLAARPEGRPYLAEIEAVLGR